MSTVLAAARVVHGDGGLSPSPAWVATEGDRIVATGSGSPPAGAHDLGDAWLAPGSVDLQVNGVGTVDFATATVDEIVDALDALAARGCTAWLPTLVSAPLDAYAPMLARLAAVRERRPGVLGVHLEGPFLGAAPGAHRPELLRAADTGWLLATCERFGDLVRMVTLAPEADPEFAATRAMVARGVVVALGHSTAAYEVALDAAGAGARIVTHVFNGMRPFHHREPGLAGAALVEPRLVPTLVADLVHVHPAVVGLVARARPDAVLVSDAVAIAGPVRAAGGAARLEGGTLAGSTTALDQCVRNVAAIGVAPAQAIRMATGNPARALGLTDVGRVAAGCRADLVALDPETLEPRAVWVSGVRRGP